MTILRYISELMQRQTTKAKMDQMRYNQIINREHII